MTDEPDDPSAPDFDDSEDWYGDADPRVPDAASGWNGTTPELPFSRNNGYVPSDYAESEAELRELERRMEENRSPAFPIDLRKHLPLEGVWRRWRQLAMWGRSDVVDDFGRDPRATAPGRATAGPAASAGARIRAQFAVPVRAVRRVRRDEPKFGRWP